MTKIVIIFLLSVQLFHLSKGSTGQKRSDVPTGRLELDQLYKIKAFDGNILDSTEGRLRGRTPGRVITTLNVQRPLKRQQWETITTSGDVYPTDWIFESKLKRNNNVTLFRLNPTDPPVLAEWVVTLMDNESNRMQMKEIERPNRIAFCLENFGLGQVVQREPCDVQNKNQLWQFIPIEAKN